MSQVFRNKNDAVVSFGDYKPWNVHKSEGGDGPGIARVRTNWDIGICGRCSGPERDIPVGIHLYVVVVRAVEPERSAGQVVGRRVVIPTACNDRGSHYCVIGTTGLGEDVITHLCLHGTCNEEQHCAQQ